MNRTRLLIVAATSTLASSVPSWGAEFPLGKDSSLTIAGLVAVGVKSSQVTDVQPTDTRKPTTELKVTDNTSRLIIGGKTELMKGWRAFFNIESRFLTNAQPIDPQMPGLPASMSQYTCGNGTGWANGDTFVGISSPYGSLAFGKATMYTSDGQAMDYFGLNGPGEGYRAWDGNALAGFNLLDNVSSVVKVGSVTAAGLSLATLGIDRSQNVIRYETPLLKGFKVTAGFTKNNNGAQNLAGESYFGRPYESGGTSWGRVTYNKAAFTAFASVLNQVVQGGKNQSTTAIMLNALGYGALFQGPMDTHAYRFGAGYKLRGFKFGFVYDHTAVENGIVGTKLTAARSATQIPLSYEWADHRVYFTYTKAGNTTNLDRTGAAQYNFGYDYALNKKTFVGIFYTTLNNDANSNYS
ncbi:MAG: porin, partial [Holophaga sp.]|nr:porin [Holophaga sp.]